MEKSSIVGLHPLSCKKYLLFCQKHILFVCLFVCLFLYVHSTIFQLCGMVLPGFNQY